MANRFGEGAKARNRSPRFRGITAKRKYRLGGSVGQTFDSWGARSEKVIAKKRGNIGAGGQTEGKNESRPAKGGNREGWFSDQTSWGRGGRIVSRTRPTPDIGEEGTVNDS